MITKTYIEFLIKNKISANQLLLLWCLNSEEKKLLDDYLREVGLKNEEVTYLINKEFLINESNEATYNIDHLFPSLEFQEAIFLDIEEAAMQIWNVWYTTMNVNGNEYAARNIDQDEFVLKYQKIVKGNIQEHFRIFTITKNYVSDNPECLMGLNKYIGTRYWEVIEKKYGKDYKKSSFIKDV